MSSSSAPTSSTTPGAPSPQGAGFLKLTGLVWYLAAALGQLAFVAFIIVFYYRRTLAGNFPGWNDKPLLKGYVEGDVAGNLMFAAHVLMAAIVTFGGLIQLVPAIRSHIPALHRWNGRLFLVTSFAMALGGLWMGWARGTNATLMSGMPLTLDAVLILVFGATAWRLAMARRIDDHRRWAMRTFMAVSGVWFLRVEIMAWALLTHGYGLTDTLSGPIDIALQYGCFLIPLAALEVYFRAQASESPITKRVVGVVILLLTALMLVGIFGAAAFLWGPYMHP